nr:hypothetical protein [Actinomadura madurae]
MTILSPNSSAPARSALARSSMSAKSPPTCGGHAVGRDALDADGGLGHVDAEWFRHMGLQGRPHVGADQAHLAARELVRVEASGDEVGVGDRGHGAPGSVGDRARVRSRAAGPDLEQAEVVEAGDRAAARADLDHVDHGEPEREPRPGLELVQPSGLEPVREGRRAVLDDAHLGGGAATSKAIILSSPIVRAT